MEEIFDFKEKKAKMKEKQKKIRYKSISPKANMIPRDAGQNGTDKGLQKPVQ